MYNFTRGAQLSVGGMSCRGSTREGHEMGAQSNPAGLRSRRHIHRFDVLRPATAGEAVGMALPDARSAFMAGGLDLIDRMKGGKTFERVILLDGIDALKAIRREGGRIVIGALATHEEIAGSDLLAGAVPDLAGLWRTIANPRVRHTGTLGGNLMSGQRHYDAAPALLALGAEAAVHTAAGVRTINIDRLADHPGALLGSISIAETPLLRLLADRSLHPVLSVYLGARVDRGKVTPSRITIGCACERPVAVDLPLGGEPISGLAAKAGETARDVVAALPAEMISDGLAGAAYRRRMCDVLIRRLLVRLAAHA
jgi:carbon-monoxide dehydrogenase medium subunit